jgi:muramoyltetrapeptide carboxypeptidase
VKLLLPPALRPGDRIGIVAPAGPVNRDRLEAGLNYLAGRGFETVLGEHLHDRLGYLAGRDEDRLADLNRMLADPKLSAVWFARGGYGSARIVEGVELKILRRRPKALIGYSDMTVVHAAAYRRIALATFHGPHVSDLGDPASFDETTLWSALSGGGGELRYPISGSTILRPGAGDGPLIGGCLSLLVSLTGTPHEASMDGAILFWEEIGEEPYRIDRMLAHLRLSGRLGKLRGMIVGSTIGCEAKNQANGLALSEILKTHLAGTAYPVVLGFPAGHAPGAMTIPLGRRARLDTADGSLRIKSD